MFFYFLCFPIYNNVYPKYFQIYKKMSINEIKDFIFESYYEIEFSKESSCYSMKLLKKKIYCLQTN